MSPTAHVGAGTAATPAQTKPNKFGAAASLEVDNGRLRAKVAHLEEQSAKARSVIAEMRAEVERLTTAGKEAAASSTATSAAEIAALESERTHLQVYTELLQARCDELATHSLPPPPPGHRRLIRPHRFVHSRRSLSCICCARAYASSRRGTQLRSQLRALSDKTADAGRRQASPRALLARLPAPSLLLRRRPRQRRGADAIAARRLADGGGPRRVERVDDGSTGKLTELTEALGERTTECGR